MAETGAARPQDDWNHGRAHLNYGMRYDQHDADTTTSQVSPRINLECHTGGRKNLISAIMTAFSSRRRLKTSKIWLKRLDTGGATAQQGCLFQPESGQISIKGAGAISLKASSVGFDAYYRNEFNTIDDDVIGSSQVDVPVNFKKGYARRWPELTYDGDLNKETSYYAERCAFLGARRPSRSPAA